MLSKGSKRVEVLETVSMRTWVKHKRQNLHVCGGKGTCCMESSTLSDLISCVLWIKKLKLKKKNEFPLWRNGIGGLLGALGPRF